MPERSEASGSPALLVLLVFQKFLKRKAPTLHRHFPYPSKKYTPAFVSVAMERKNSGCWEPPKKKGLSFSIEEILKSEEVRLDEKGGGDAGHAAAADTEMERPSTDQAPGKCLSGFLLQPWVSEAQLGSLPRGDAPFQEKEDAKF